MDRVGCVEAVFETIDPQGFAFAACDFTLADGSVGSQRHLCDVVRTLDALDEKASRRRIKISDDDVNGKSYSLAGGASLVFSEKRVDGVHVFRTPFSGHVFCDRVLHDAIRATGVDGVELVDAAEY